MTDPVPGGPGAMPVPRRLTLAVECAVIGVLAAVCSAAVTVVTLTNSGSAPLFGCLPAIVFAFSHAMWITVDCKRRGAEVGWWRFAAIFFGPLAVWIYLAVTYGLRALYLIPVSIAVYVAIFVPALVVAMAMLASFGHP